MEGWSILFRFGSLGLLLFLSFFGISLNNLEELVMVEQAAFQNLPEIGKLELCNNPRLSYIDPQAFR